MYACNMTEPPRQKRGRIQGTPQTRGILKTTDLRDIRCVVCGNPIAELYLPRKRIFSCPTQANSPCRGIESQDSGSPGRGRRHGGPPLSSRGPLSGAAIVLCFALVGHDGLSFSGRQRILGADARADLLMRAATCKPQGVPIQALPPLTSLLPEAAP